MDGKGAALPGLRRPPREGRMDGLAAAAAAAAAARDVLASTSEAPRASVLFHLGVEDGDASRGLGFGGRGGRALLRRKLGV
ncbi:hypothetical protein E2320_013129 [Naja naja]|nr:hypothetical protein E2320_013129 [Naja naja]